MDNRTTGLLAAGQQDHGTTGPRDHRTTLERSKGLAERGAFVAFGAGAVDDDIMGIDTETAETPSEPGRRDFDGWSANARGLRVEAVRTGSKSIDQRIGENPGRTGLSEDFADVGQKELGVE